MAGKLLRRITYWLQRRRLERELAEEMEAHREMMAPDRRAHFGNVRRLHDEARDVWSFDWIENVWQDLCYGIRVLLRAPGFTLGATLVLALGVGVNLAEFQIFDAMIFHRLTFRDAGAVLQFVHTSSEGSRLGFPPAALEIFRSSTHSFRWLLFEEASFDSTVEDETGVRTNLIPAEYFSSLGIVAAHGRLLDARDSAPEAPSAGVLGYDYWQTRFGGDPRVIGRVLRINQQPVEIVGVLPYTFDGLMARGTAVWLPAAMRSRSMPASTRIQRDFARSSEALYGVPKPGVTQAEAEAELTSLARELAREHPLAFHSDERVQGHLLQESIPRSIQRYPPVAIFMVMVLLILLSACANLGNMLLARGLARQREFQIRQSIGAGRARMIRQLMTENLLLAVLGTAAGVGFGAISSRILLAVLGAPPGFRVTMGLPLIAGGFILALVASFVFGLPSTLQLLGSSQTKIRLRRGLVSVQVAVSCLLLIASGVLAHNGIVAASKDLAFDYRNMIVVKAQRSSGVDARQKMENLTERLSALPGVIGVTSATVAPVLEGNLPLGQTNGSPRIAGNAVAPSYFAVMDLPVLRGRTFFRGEVGAIIASESAARRLWPNQDPIGKPWDIAGAIRTVVGVVKDSGANLLADEDSVEAYISLAEDPRGRTVLIVHARTDPGRVASLIPSAATALDETAAVTLMRVTRDRSLDALRRITLLIGSIGAVATGLAAAGMFALIAFAVAQRRRELGVRIAIGATPWQILAVLLRQHARPTAIGGMVGVLLALILARVVRGYIFLFHHEVDLMGFALGLVFFALVAGAATLLPALRALRLDPSVTLREE